ncbi:MAG: NAD(P)-dependent oxidoreductase [Natrialbaceae archaeon]|nr:NAD(P)-dependent oxidoreductase [Natrialbaceae archaeon]
MAQTALVTGACGFTGGHMVELLVDNGWNVVATDLEGTERDAYYTEGEGAVPSPVYYKDVFADGGVEFIPADLTEAETLEPVFAAHEYDAIFHIASLFDYFAEMEVLQAVNVDGARNLAEKAIEHDVGHFIHWSTLGVLGDAGFDSPKTEDAPYEPHNRYCVSKVDQEELLLDLHENEGLPLTIIRPAPIYGPRHRYGVYHILLLLRKFGTVFVTRIYPRSKQPMFPSVHVTDLTEAALFLQEQGDVAIGETYNVTSDCLAQDTILEFLGGALGVRSHRLPLPYSLFKLYARFTKWSAHRLERKARSHDMRPKIDASMTHYLGHNMWFSNEKLTDLGFEFTYRDPRRGLWDYITWCKEEGLI